LHLRRNIAPTAQYCTCRAILNLRHNIGPAVHYCAYCAILCLWLWTNRDTWLFVHDTHIVRFISVLTYLTINFVRSNCERKRIRSQYERTKCMVR
jgi:hypothetical protein